MTEPLTDEKKLQNIWDAVSNGMLDASEAELIEEAGGEEAMKEAAEKLRGELIARVSQEKEIRHLRKELEQQQKAFLVAAKEMGCLREELKKEKLGIEIMADGSEEHDAEQQEKINRLSSENEQLHRRIDCLSLIEENKQIIRETRALLDGEKPCSPEFPPEQILEIDDEGVVHDLGVLDGEKP